MQNLDPPIARKSITFCRILKFAVCICAAAVAGCNRQATEGQFALKPAVVTAITEPAPIDKNGVDSAINGLLANNATRCTTPPSALQKWACSRRDLMKTIDVWISSNREVSSKLEGSAAMQVYGADTQAVTNNLKSCLGSPAATEVCLTSVIEARLEIMKTVGPDGSPVTLAARPSSSAASTASPKFGSYEPFDYKRMTRADFLAMHAAQLKEASDRWSARLPELVVQEDCTAPSRGKITEEAIPGIIAASKRCDGSLAPLISNRDGIMRKGGYGTWPISEAVQDACLPDVRWLVAHCDATFISPGEDAFPLRKRISGVDTYGSAGTEEEWLTRKPKLAAFLEVTATMRATAGSWHAGSSSGDGNALASAAKTGFPKFVRLVASTGFKSDRDWEPLIAAIAFYRVAGCTAGIVTEHCAARFEVIKTVVGVGEDPNGFRNSGKPMKEARRENIKELLDFLKWVGADATEPQAQKPLDPRVAACMQHVNDTLSTSTDYSNAYGMAVGVHRQAKALQECQQLADGRAAPSGGALSSVAAHERVVALAKRIAQGRHPLCSRIGEELGGIASSRAYQSKPAVDLFERAEQYHCI